MYEAAEEENPSIHWKPRKQSPSYSFMDLDIDFDPSWPSNQNPFLCDHSSPFLLSLASSPSNPNTLSLSEQPCSPLWAFSDGGDEENSGGKERPSFGAALRFFQRPKYLSCNSDPLSRSFTGEEEKRRFFSTSMGLAHMEIPDGSCLIKERMMQALRYFKETMEQQVLAQVWAPVKNGDRYVLTTSEQPFVLDPQSNGLLQYRTVSLNYMFSVDGESDGDLGLPGRVFLHKLPEWTPNVQYYSTKEYPRLKHALQFDVRGTLALPVIEPSEQSCIGVVELIMTSHKIKYATEVDKVCKALEAVNLKSSEILDHPSSQICNEGRQNALVEILEILTVVCETHKLPLAQTWVPCRHRRVLAYGGGVKKSCTSFDGNCMGQVCMSTTDVAYYVVDAHMLGFRGACLEHHLQKEQGVAGRAFSSQGLCFSSDVTQFSKNQYPLVHYARMFGLAGCFAICLQSRHTGTDDYILEFFLPPNITDMKEQQVFLDSLLATMNQHFRSLMVASGNQLIDERYIEIVGTSVSENLDSNFQSVQISGAQSPPRPNGLSDKGFNIQSDFLEQQLMVETDDLGKGDKLVHINGNHPTVVSSNKGTGKTSEKKRGKSEKSISLEVLQQYFAGSLKDAAKSLGVCPTTMKRICRQHGISRWPSRKINKVNRSLTKLQRVIESVHGAEGAFNRTSLAASPLPVPVGSISWPVCLNGLKEQNSSGPKLSELQGARTDAPAIVTPESDAQGYMRNQIHEGGDLLALQELVHKPNESSLENSNGSTRFKVRSGSADESTETPTSHGSCQGSPADVTMPANASHPSIQEQIENIGSSFFLEFQPNPEMNFSTACAILDAPITEETQLPLGGMLVEDAGSSKDLINLSNCHMDKQDRESSWRNPPCPEKSPEQEIAAPIHAMVHTTGTQGMRSVTMKVGYKEDIIRFRLSLTSGLIDLKEEVAKRFKLEVGTFDIKYSDDDSEWVLLACDADLQECMDTWSLSGKHIIRLSAHDIVANLGSSCESTGEWREK